MKYCKPNLPYNMVTMCAVGNRNIAERLTANFGIKTIIIPKNTYLEEKISHHADMNILYLGCGKYIGYEKLLPDEFLFINEKKPEKPDYPYSVKLNGCIMGDKIIGNSKYLTDKAQDFTLISVKQGYGKCSCMPITEHAAITGDASIASELVKQGIDVLKISQNDIFLSGYVNGFIGGCGGLISKDILITFGKINSINDGENIKAFCRNYGVYIEELLSGNLTDFGGIIPLKEKL